MRAREDVFSNSFSRKEIIKHIVHDGLQTFFTPFDLVEKMIPRDLQGSVRVFFNLEFLEVLVSRNYDMKKVQYVGDTEEKVAFSQIYGVESVLIGKEDWDKILKNQKNIKEFFVGCKMNQAADVTFSNPPYRDVDLKIILALKKVNMLKKLICVHPSAWLVDIKTRLDSNRGKQLFQKMRSLTNEHLESVEFFDPNPVFGIGLGTDCVISKINFEKVRTKPIKVRFLNTSKFIDIKDINDISLHGENWYLLKDLIPKLQKFINTNGSFETQRISSREAEVFHKDEIFVQLSTIRTNKRDKPQSNFYTLSPMNVEKVKTIKGVKQKQNFLPRSISNVIPGEIVFIFSSEENKNNFLSAIKTDFIRLCISIIKINSSLNIGELALVPWLDFNQSWDDDKLFSFFGYPKSHLIREYAKTFLPDYHKLYPNGKTY
jgi:hypothetical protein